VLKSALIVFRGGYCTLRCQILESSDAGARLKPADIMLCPGEFVLKPLVYSSRDGEIVWRKGTTLARRSLSVSTPWFVGPFEKPICSTMTGQQVTVFIVRIIIEPSKIRGGVDRLGFVSALKQFGAISNASKTPTDTCRRRSRTLSVTRSRQAALELVE
jgi:hypothetical protein